MNKQITKWISLTTLGAILVAFQATPSQALIGVAAQNLDAVYAGLGIAFGIPLLVSIGGSMGCGNGDDDGIINCSSNGIEKSVFYSFVIGIVILDDSNGGTPQFQTLNATQSAKWFSNSDLANAYNRAVPQYNAISSSIAQQRVQMKQAGMDQSLIDSKTVQIWNDEIATALDPAAATALNIVRSKLAEAVQTAAQAQK